MEYIDFLKQKMAISHETGFDMMSRIADIYGCELAFQNKEE